ncbi:MAG: peptide release factor-glutamine N5-methyltransferase [uncultured bacterium]|nr:MAG: peptide release factor-glutamine N5-methyltransferase [uncultured bacterium]OGT32817.1 MAG: protein-(glutamine-N5) methyltransferase, release factor-specific [Gammaproteobacteria bacterium RIFCSPHIGHO2_02_FULL_39_13]OGT49937.1 MAG: protein-(glutamine-N5) methyltransferase, release factor-specific [Gammaproteobacteria bacterium RIFCSPHIGHO2_12_FULL_39_24]
MNIAEYRKKISTQFAALSQTPQLDAELLMMHVTKKSRTELFLNLNKTLSAIEEKKIKDLVTRRMQGEPIAYLLGYQPFWTLDLMVTPDTLIPRPETECLIDWILHHIDATKNCVIADLGTGTGAIAIALASERKNWHIDAVDQSAEALAIAKKNIDQYNIKNISLYISDWYAQLSSHHYDIIVSNPPYIAENDVRLEKLTFEPAAALISGKEGLDAIRKVVSDAKKYLNENGYLVIEHGFDQADAVMTIFKNAGFHDIKNHRDLSDIPRFVTGC